MPENDEKRYFYNDRPSSAAEFANVFRAAGFPMKAQAPDFDQIAQHILGVIVLPQSGYQIKQDFVDALRQVWNARGAADRETLDTVAPEPPELTATGMVQYSPLKARRDWWREGYARATTTLDSAIRNLDR